MGDARDHREQADELRRDIMKTHKGLMADHQQKQADLIAERDRLQVEIDQDETTIEGADGALESARRLHAEAKARREQIGEEPDLKDLQTAYKKQVEIAAKKREELNQAAAADAARLAFELIIKEIEGLETYKKVYSAIEWACQRAREEGIASTGSACVEDMTRFLEAAGRAEKPYFNARKGHVDIGWSKGDMTVDVETMARSGFALFTAALTASILVARKAPVRILLVEAGEVDRQNLPKLLAGIDSIADRLTGVIVMTHLEVSDEPEGWQVLRLEKETAEA